MSGPDLRWEGISHKEIVAWMSKELDTSAIDAIVTRLASLGEVLNGAADMKNTIVQKINSGEWSGSAATVAAQAMRVLRDFDDTMGHRSETNILAIHGQAGNAAWARANVPPVVDTRVVQAPTGRPIDVLNSTVDHQHQLQAAKDAEEQARQVMRQYQAMTEERIAALPPLAPAPTVAVGGGHDTITVGSGPERLDDVSPRGTLSVGDAGPDGSTEASRQAPPSVADPLFPAPPGDGGPTDRVPGHRDTSGTEPSRAGSPQVIGSRPLTSAPLGVGETPRAPGALAHGIIAGPGGEGAPPGRQPGRTVLRLGPAGTTPVGMAAPPRSEEDKEHQVKYAVPGSEIFEPDSDDGLLFDPFRPGSFVAPSSIGDDDDE